MSIQITVTLPENIYQRAQNLVELSGYDMSEVLIAALDSLPQLASRTPISVPIEALSDDEVVELTALQMDKNQDERLSSLLDKQQSGKIKEVERIELQALMKVYELGTLRKAQALDEAVKRGLRETLAS